MPPLDRTIKALRARVTLWRNTGQKIALVPTMGSLHAGHLALVAEGKRRAKRVLVTIFVNPAQFAPTEDFKSYPRDEDSDLEKLGEAGVDAVFIPTAEEIYPPGFATTITVGGPAADLEGEARPQFFNGVATVVAKLFQIATPDMAIFGEKDYQQLLVVRRMAEDLNFPVEVIGHPTVREPDGLAMSSRNAYLKPFERENAPLLYENLKLAAQELNLGSAPRKVLAATQKRLGAAGFRVDYVKLCNAETLAPVTDPDMEPKRLLAAVWIGKARLIDNIPV